MFNVQFEFLQEWHSDGKVVVSFASMPGDGLDPSKFKQDIGEIDAGNLKIVRVYHLKGRTYRSFSWGLICWAFCKKFLW